MPERTARSCLVLMLQARLRNVANVARRATCSVRTDSVAFSQVVWDPKNSSKQLSKELEPALYVVATPLGVNLVCMPCSVTKPECFCLRLVPAVKAKVGFVSCMESTCEALELWRARGMHSEWQIHCQLSVMKLKAQNQCVGCTLFSVMQ